MSIAPGDQEFLLRDGKAVILKSGVTLPGLCPFTGRAPGPYDSEHTFHFGWNPPWTRVALLFLPAYFALLYFNRIENWGMIKWLDLRVGGIPWGGLLLLMVFFLSIRLFFNNRKHGFAHGVISRRVVQFNNSMAILCGTIAIVGAGILLIMGAGIIFRLPLFNNERVADHFFALGFKIMLASPIPLFLRKRLRAKRFDKGWFRIAGCHRRLLEQIPPAPSGSKVH